jgi:hypothetical protein
VDDARDDDAWLELDAPETSPAPDPTPDLPAAGDDEAFLEVMESAEGAGPRVLTDDDLATVVALADDALPLLAALYARRDDLAAALPTPAELRARLDDTRRALNQVTRRGPEWRARAEVAAAALTRRLDALPRGDGLHPAATAEFLAWCDLSLATQIRHESAGDGTLREPELARLRLWCARRGMDPSRIDALAARAQIPVHHGEHSAWAPLDALPDAPRSLDEAARALVTSVAQSVTALRARSLSAWLRAHRAPEDLCVVADEAEAVCLAHDGVEGAPAVAVWSLAWSLGLDGVTVDGLLVTSPDTLRGHLRGRRLDARRLRDAAPALAAWFARTQHPGLARALQRLTDGSGDDEGVSWALGEPLRLGERTVADPAALARDVLQRSASRAAAEERLHNGSLRAWLDALPPHRRDPAWLDALTRAPDPAAREAAFWPGVYRRAPRAPLRLALDERARRVVRLEGIADLLNPARTAAVWSPLRAAWRRGELSAWLTHAAPGIDLDHRPELPEDHALHALLWSLGFSALVLPWGLAGLAAVTPEDLVAAWRRGPAHLETLLPQGVVTAWLRRFFPHTPDLDLALHHWGDDLGAGRVPPGHAALRLALLCGATALPRDPLPAGEGEVVAWESVDPAARGEAPWRALPPALMRSGAVLLWAARRVPAAGLLARRWLQGEVDDEGALRELAEMGAPVPSRALEAEQAREQTRRAAVERRRALEDESARLAARRDAAREALELEVDRLAAAQQAAREAAAREVARREVAHELAAAHADRDAARGALAQALARAQAERELAEATRQRALAEADLARHEALAAQRAALHSAARERDEARLEAQRAAAALRVQSARQHALEAELATEAARRRVAEARLAQESVDAALESLARKDMERVEALRRLREAEVALRDEEARQRRAAKELEAQATRAADDARRAVDEAREDEARRREAEAAQRAALEAQGRTAEADVAEALAREAARTREAAEAAAAVRAEAERREAEIAEAWATARREAEAEIARLTDALRGVEAEADALQVPTPEAPAEDPFAALAGALEDPADAVDDDDPDAALDPDAPRAEYALDLLAESYDLADDAALARLRDAVDRWARRRPTHPWADLAERMTVRALTLLPAFELHVSTRFESRAVVPSPPSPTSPLPVAGEARADDGAVDPWALDLPESDPWSSWEGELPLDVPDASQPCGACAGADAPGRVACSACEGRGSTACRRCEGWGKVTCPRCAGGGELSAAEGSGRCPRCDGRRTVPCEGCVLGRVPCAPCEGSGARACAACGGDGVVLRGAALRVASLPVSALSVVGDGLPAEVRAAVRARDAEPSPVVFVEAPEIDVADVLREIPHRALAAAAGAMLSAERAADGDRRATRQRLIVRRYPVWRAEVEVHGRAHTLWVHGARREVFTDDSPLARWLQEQVEAAREALGRNDLATAVDRLAGVMAADLDHEDGRAAARAVGEAVRAQALRGELFDARENATRAAALRWPECLGPLAEAERVLGRRLSQRASWSVLEEARGALEKDRLERCADRLRELAQTEPESAEGRALAAELGAKTAVLARAMAARGELAAAVQRVEMTAALPWDEARDALVTVREELARAQRRGRWVTVAPWIIAALAVLGLLLSRLR